MYNDQLYTLQLLDLHDAEIKKKTLNTNYSFSFKVSTVYIM